MTERITKDVSKQVCKATQLRKPSRSSWQVSLPDRLPHALIGKGSVARPIRYHAGSRSRH
jgi:hypothetical protein